MSADPKEFSAGAVAQIQIVRLNSEKTRKDNDSDTVYHVYFELSDYPPTEWRNIFDRQWNALKSTRKAFIDGMFLVVHCTLDEVATIQLPALKTVVVETNASYRQFALNEAAALERREDVWTQERKNVDAMEEGLQFDKKE